MSGEHELLRALASGIHAARPAGAAPQAPRPAGPGAPDFQSLLALARAGQISSGLDVSVASDSGVTLMPDQLARLAPAADRAEAAGIQHALVMIDGLALRLDVKTRTITGQADLSAGPLPGIDGVVSVPAREAAPPPLGLPGATPHAPSLLRLLAQTAGPSMPARTGAA
ncbi:MAG TPA: hypothetical protein VD963_05635 [Phycisphaerales bacterium]|nr:hypothetical protein [Phycisphaerales bacterium]